jgi:hypothetical protein
LLKRKFTQLVGEEIPGKPGWYRMAPGACYIMSMVVAACFGWACANGWFVAAAINAAVVLFDFHSTMSWLQKRDHQTFLHGANQAFNFMKHKDLQDNNEVPR